ncbi:MAG TPA: S-layer homology domain-containing protein [Egicoccus sp.]|nr:S-layer homology domain-containing protein [Egicoccus sp.]HSK24986.1 S-layer homology domain-containing protein [Egicoccus sp.]
MRRRLPALTLALALVATGAAPALAADTDPGVIVYTRNPGDVAADERGHDLVAVTPDAESFQTLYEGWSGVALSPSARWVVRLVRDRETENANAVEVSRTDGSGLWRLPYDRHVDLTGATWSPDGAHLAYAVADGDAPTADQVEIHVVDLITRTVAVVPVPDEVAGVIDLRWSPDGDWFVFDDWAYAGLPGMHHIVWRMRVDGTEAQSLAGSRDGAAPSSAMDPAWSPDGRSIAFTHADEDESSTGLALWVMDADGENAREVLPATGDWIYGLAWSPDGTQLAMSRDPSGLQDATSIWRVGVDGSGLVRVTQPPPPVRHLVDDWRHLSTSTRAACPPGEVPDSGFTDTSGHPHRAGIDCATWLGLANGRSEHTYDPVRPVLRGQLATFLARLLEASGVALPPPTDQGFTDVEASHHADAINQLAELGIVQGVTDTTYEPSWATNRAQMAALLVRTYEYITDSALTRAADEFDDDDGSAHEAAIDKAANAGLTGGHSVSSYQPIVAVKRGQMATFLTRIANRLVIDGRIILPE